MCRKGRNRGNGSANMISVGGWEKGMGSTSTWVLVIRGMEDEEMERIEGREKGEKMEEPKSKRLSGGMTVLSAFNAIPL